jgi:hypothetical protein
MYRKLKIIHKFREQTIGEVHLASICINVTLLTKAAKAQHEEGLPINLHRHNRAPSLVAKMVCHLFQCPRIKMNKCTSALRDNP